jgi:hypothetical protein
VQYFQSRFQVRGNEVKFYICMMHQTIKGASVVAPSVLAASVVQTPELVSVKMEMHRALAMARDSSIIAVRNVTLMTAAAAGLCVFSNLDSCHFFTPLVRCIGLHMS